MKYTYHSDIISDILEMYNEVHCDGLISRPRSPADCVKDQETEKAAKAQRRAVEP
jgi:hypothetical protein